jgi:glutaredoxin
MPIYVCEKCDYKAKTKQLIKRHINKINPCSNQIIIVSRDTNLDLLDNDTTYENMTALIDRPNELLERN